jgi:hypothetical protein
MKHCWYSIFTPGGGFGSFGFRLGLGFSAAAASSLAAASRLAAASLCAGCASASAAAAAFLGLQAQTTCMNISGLRTLQLKIALKNILTRIIGVHHTLALLSSTVQLRADNNGCTACMC